MNQLEQLASLTTIVADTGDIASIAKIQPQDTTTNPSLILKASKDPAYQAFLTEAVENSVSLEDARRSSSRELRRQRSLNTSKAVYLPK